jgi:hypothetical protein
MRVVRHRLRLNPSERTALAVLAEEEQRQVRDQIEVLVREGLTRWRRRQQRRGARVGRRLELVGGG